MGLGESRWHMEKWWFRCLSLFLTEVVYATVGNPALMLSECTVELKDELRGPFCTERDVKDAEMLQMIKEMNQCMSGFQILEQKVEGGDYKALAIPKSSCRNLNLRCDKPLDVFPNSCSAAGDLLGNTTQKHFEVAFYAYDDGLLGRVLAIETYLPDDRRCLGKLLPTEGSCFRLKEPSQKVVGAPRAPEIVGMIDYFIRPPGDSPDTCVANLDGTLEGCEVNELLRSCAEKYRFYPRDQGESMGYAEPNVNGTCNLMKITCNKSFGEFPNACSGKMTVKGKETSLSAYVAFYAYSQSHRLGLRTAKVWESRIVVDKQTTCSGHYVLGCSGVMTIYLDMEASDILAPPMPPALNGMPRPFPMLTPREVATTEAPQPSQPKPTKAPVSPLPWLVAGVCLGAFFRLLSAFFDRRRRRVEEHRMQEEVL